MQPAAYNTFYAASAGAGAALIGLLFVSVSLAPENTLHTDAPWERRAAATSAFTALVNALFVSFGALLPEGDLGGTAVVMSILSLLTSLRLGGELLRGRSGGGRAVLQRGLLVLVALSIYGFQLWNGLLLLRHGADTGAQQAIAWVVISTYGMGLARAWELLGAQRYSLFTQLARPHTGDPAPANAAAKSQAESEAGSRG